MTPEAFHAARKFAQTEHGRIAYVEAGDGPAALFVHGFPLNGFHWRGVIDGVRDVRRCIAPDLMGMGYSETRGDQPLDFISQADMLAGFLDAIGVDTVDVVGNDSGTAIAQLFAVRHPRKVRTLCLTNGDAHDNYPPPAFTAMHDLAKEGKLGDMAAAMLANPDMGREAFRLACEHPEELSDEALKVYLAPLVASPQRRVDVSRYIAAMDNRQMTDVEGALRRLAVPALVVWGDDDPYFPAAWGEWLAEALPDARLATLRGGRLFLPEERAEEVSALLREFWA